MTAVVDTAAELWDPIESDLLDVEVLLGRLGPEVMSWCRGRCGRAVIEASRYRARVLGDSTKRPLGPAPGPELVVWSSRFGLCGRCASREGMR